MKYLFLLRSFLAVLFGIFLLLTTWLYIYQDLYNKISNGKLYLITAIAFLVFVLWIFSLYFFYKFSLVLNKEVVVKETDRLQLVESQKLIQTLRSQHHDFKNQLQVIKALAQLNKTEEIIKYIQECTQVIDLSSSILTRIENPTISAMILVFTTHTREKGISFNVDCDLDFSQCNLSPFKVTRMIGNIIQNAIEMFEGTFLTQRAIQLTMWETKDFFHFIIWNNGPVIPEQIKEQIYISGYSTKGSTGLGLSIVRELVEEMNGKLIVKSDLDSGTEFKIVIPKNLANGQVGEH